MVYLCLMCVIIHWAKTNREDLVGQRLDDTGPALDNGKSCSEGMLGLSDKLAICVESDRHHPRHISQRGNLQIEEISGNCSLKMPPLKPALVTQ